MAESAGVRRATVAEVLVIRGVALNDNPYVSEHVSGPPRADALRSFRDTGAADGVELWFGPPSGGAYLITSPDQIDWSGLRD